MIDVTFYFTTSNQISSHHFIPSPSISHLIVISSHLISSHHITSHDTTSHLTSPLFPSLSTSATADGDDEEDEFDDETAASSYHIKHEKGDNDSDDDNDGLRKDFVKTEKSARKSSHSHSNADLRTLGVDGIPGPLGTDGAAARWTDYFICMPQ